MKTLEEFNTFLDQQLRDELNTLEQQRIAGRNWIRWMWVATLAPFAVFVFFIVRYSLRSTGNTAGQHYGNQVFLLIGLVLLVTLASSRLTELKPNHSLLRK